MPAPSALPSPHTTVQHHHPLVKPCHHRHRRPKGAVLGCQGRRPPASNYPLPSSSAPLPVHSPHRRRQRPPSVSASYFSFGMSTCQSRSEYPTSQPQVPSSPLAPPTKRICRRGSFDDRKSWPLHFESMGEFVRWKAAEEIKHRVQFNKGPQKLPAGKYYISLIAGFTHSPSHRSRYANIQDDYSILLCPERSAEYRASQTYRWEVRPQCTDKEARLGSLPCANQGELSELYAIFSSFLITVSFRSKPFRTGPTFLHSTPRPTSTKSVPPTSSIAGSLRPRGISPLALLRLE